MLTFVQVSRTSGSLYFGPWVRTPLCPRRTGPSFFPGQKRRQKKATQSPAPNSFQEFGAPHCALRLTGRLRGPILGAPRLNAPSWGVDPAPKHLFGCLQWDPPAGCSRFARSKPTDGLSRPSQESGRPVGLPDKKSGSKPPSLKIGITNQLISRNRQMIQHLHRLTEKTPAFRIDNILIFKNRAQRNGKKRTRFRRVGLL